MFDLNDQLINQQTNPYLLSLELETKIIEEAEKEPMKERTGYLYEGAVLALKGKGFHNEQIVNWFKARGIEMPRIEIDND